MTVKEIMSTNVACVKKDDNIIDVAEKMNRYNIGAIPVVGDEDRVCGIITDRDIVLRCVAKQKEAKSCKAEDVMSQSTCCISSDQSISEAIDIMSEQQIRRLPVTDNGKLCGMVSLGDIARIRISTEVSQALTEISMP